jgi:two-component system, OmpR family, phosphate regulon sensor histidine kinase PhoR
MTARIFLKLISSVLLVMIVAVTAVDFLASQMSEQAYIEELRRELSEKTRMIAVLAREDVLRLDAARVRDLGEAAGGRVTVIDRDGRVLLDSENDAAKMENHGHRPEVKAALEGKTGTALRVSPTMGIDFLYVASPVQGGVVRLAVPLTQVKSQVAFIRKRLLLYTALAFLPAILLAGFFARYFSARLGAIIDYASTLATGNFLTRLKHTGSDELGTLARQLNETGEKLRKMFEELQTEHLELERVERVRKDFVINVSHELRTPLASIQGYTETLLEGALHDDKNNIRFLNIIRQNAERLGRLTSDLLILSRIELKTQRFQFASYYVNPLISDCVESLRPIVQKKRINLQFLPAPEDAEVFCDSEAVHQIMSNLVDNAAKYTSEGGSITVSFRAVPGESGKSGSPEMVEIRVSDSGIGIPAEELPRLFERFYRVDKARSRELGGTGLGLAIVKHLVRAQGGDVGVESTVNKGSTFYFRLPVHDQGIGELGDSREL